MRSCPSHNRFLIIKSVMVMGYFNLLFSDYAVNISEIIVLQFVNTVVEKKLTQHILFCGMHAKREKSKH